MILPESCEKCQTRLPEGKLKCTSCGNWNPPKKPPSMGIDALVPVSKIPRHSIPRLITGPWDICFGGGIFPKTITLIGGDPGIGKSTLMLQIADSIAGIGYDVNDTCKPGKVIYIHTEEGKEQVAETIDRLKLKHQDNIYLLADTSEEIRDSLLEEMLLEAKPDLLILDSLPGFAGDNDPTRALELIHLFKKKLGQLTLISNHVNKENEQAGYKDIQHAVDATMIFDVEEAGMRKLTTRKNRHGPAPVSIYFEMTDSGLKHHPTYEP